MRTTLYTLKNWMKNQIPYYFGGALLITHILFFVDEGYYNFSWMENIGNWIIFAIYVSVIFLGQLLFSHLLLKNYLGPGKFLFSLIGGIILGVAILIFAIFTRW